MEDKRFQIAHSNYFGKDIMCVRYVNDNEWYFCFINEKKEPTSGIRRAQTRHSYFFWHK